MLTTEKALLLAAVALVAVIADGFTPSQSTQARAARRPVLVCTECGHTTRSPRRSAQHMTKERERLARLEREGAR